jgi:hypothetical protein
MRLLRTTQDLRQRFSEQLSVWKIVTSLIANAQVRGRFGGGRGTRTHKSFRTTVFKCVVGRPDWPCLLLPEANRAGQRQHNFLIGASPSPSLLPGSLTKR